METRCLARARSNSSLLTQSDPGHAVQAELNFGAQPSYEELFGLTRDQIRGRHIRDVIGARLFELNEPYIRQALSGNPVLFEREIPIPAGGSRRSQARYIPDVGADGIEGFFVLVTDVTELRRARDALEIAHAELEQRVLERTAELRRFYVFMRYGGVGLRSSSFNANELSSMPFQTDAP